MLWTRLDPSVHLGLIPHFLQEHDDRNARDQFNDRYSHGGGWLPMQGWSMDPVTNWITYTDSKGEKDDPLAPLARTQLRDEAIFVYDYDWVAIVQPDGTFEVSRMD